MQRKRERLAVKHAQEEVMNALRFADRNKCFEVTGRVFRKLAEKLFGADEHNPDWERKTCQDWLKKVESKDTPQEASFRRRHLLEETEVNRRSLR